MPESIGREDLARLLEEGAQLVEVLPAQEYEEEHLPRAINVPLAKLTREVALARLEPARPVIVYCWDYQ
ncbi:MAG TPA: rhodanese-like domain-containing protein [Dehalococcoidia bacterium]|nr:rhodanese-like domain-containing protein [Dehalococcoidia bacterium]